MDPSITTFSYPTHALTSPHTQINGSPDCAATELQTHIGLLKTIIQ